MPVKKLLSLTLMLTLSLNLHAGLIKKENHQADEDMMTNIEARLSSSDPNNPLFTSSKNVCLPLHYVCGHKHEDSAKLIQKLFEQGADFDAKYKLMTPYELAINASNLPAIKKLEALKKTAMSPFATPLHYACLNGDQEVIEYFLLRQEAYDKTCMLPTCPTLFHVPSADTFLNFKLNPFVYTIKEELQKILPKKKISEKEKYDLFKNLSPFATLCLHYAKQVIMKSSKDNFNHDDFTLLELFLKKAPCISYVRNVLAQLGFELVEGAEQRLRNAEWNCCIS